MTNKICANCAVSLDDLPNQVRAHHVHLEFSRDSGGGGDQALDIELVGVGHQPDHRLLVIRVATNVSQNHQAWLLGSK
jgi:hypothetical protein